jgi:hypothetical protein
MQPAAGLPQSLTGCYLGRTTRFWIDERRFPLGWNSALRSEAIGPTVLTTKFLGRAVARSILPPLAPAPKPDVWRKTVAQTY